MLTLHSPAKINLFLRILNRREDGYHNLSSLFQAIDLHDVLSLSLSGQDNMTCTDPSLPVDEKNLVMKAIALFRRKTKLPIYATVHLEKHIPHQAGLGGGSSNAATALWGLNLLAGKPVNDETLMAWGAEIGSDVAFFLSKGTAHCTGRGEVIKPLEAFLNNLPITIIKPCEGLSTPQVFRCLDLQKLSPRNPDLLLEKITHHFFENNLINDLEEPAFRLEPKLQELKNKLLNSGYKNVLMSGSGTAFFCLGNEGKITKTEALFIAKTTPVNRINGVWYNCENFAKKSLQKLKTFG